MFESKVLEDFLKGEITIYCDSLEEMVTFQEILAEKGVLWSNGRSPAKSMSIYPHDAYRINSEGLLCTTIARYDRKPVVNYRDVFPKPTIKIPEILKNTIEEMWFEIEEV